MNISSSDLINLLAALNASFNMQNQPSEPANAEDVIEGVREVLSEAAAYPKQSSNHQILALTIPERLTTDELLDELLDILEEYGIEDRTWICVNGIHYPRDDKDSLMFELHKKIKSVADGKDGREDIHVGFDSSSIAFTFQDISNIRNWTEMYHTGIKRLTINGLTITL